MPGFLGVSAVATMKWIVAAVERMDERIRRLEALGAVSGYG
jgi:hypothetical protein